MMRSLIRGKKGDADWKIIFGIIIGVLILGILIYGVPPYFKNLFGLKEHASPYEACNGKEDGDACATKEYTGVCKDSMCVKEDIAAYTLEQATELFQSTFKKNIELCGKNDQAGCANATKTVENILNFVDDDGESRVDILVVKLDDLRSDFILRKNKKILIFFPAGKKDYVSFRYTGNTSFYDADKSEFKYFQKDWWDKAGIRKGSNGLQVFRIANEGALNGDGRFDAIDNIQNILSIKFTNK